MAVNLWPIRNQRERRVVLYVERDADWNRSRGASCYVQVMLQCASRETRSFSQDGGSHHIRCLKRPAAAFGFFFVTMRGGDLSLLIGSQLRALLLTQYGRVRVTSRGFARAPPKRDNGRLCG